MLGMAEDRFRVDRARRGRRLRLQAATIYGEEALVGWCSRKLGRPVKWIDDALRGHVVGAPRPRPDRLRAGWARSATARSPRCTCGSSRDLGAYLHAAHAVHPGASRAFVMSGCYKIPQRPDRHRRASSRTSSRPTRSAAPGGPEATHLIEVMIDQLAAELGMDRARAAAEELHPQGGLPGRRRGRRRSTTPATTTARSTSCSSKLDLDAFRREQEELREQRRLPRHRLLHLHGDLRPGAVARGRARAASASRPASGSPRSCACTRRARRRVYTGSSPHGQGHETGFAQIVADRLGIDARPGRGHPRRHRRRARSGMGTYGSRSLAVGGESVGPRRRQGRGQGASKIAAHLLEAAPEDMELADGKYRVKGSPDKGLALADISLAAYVPENMPEGMEPGLEETTSTTRRTSCSRSARTPRSSTWTPRPARSSSSATCAVDDCGPAINPMLIDGQVHGGIAHGVGQAHVRAGRLRRRRAARDRHVRRLRAAHRGRAAVVRDRPHRDAVAGELAGREGRRARRARSPRRRPSSTPWSTRCGRSASPTSTCRSRRCGCGRRSRPGPGPGRGSEQGKQLDEHGGGAAGSGPTAPEEGGAQ